jgi:hypothetical protein
MQSKFQVFFCLLLVKTSCAGFTANSARLKARKISDVPRSGSMTTVQKQKQRSSNSSLRAFSFITDNDRPKDAVPNKESDIISRLKEDNNSATLQPKIQEETRTSPCRNPAVVFFNTASRVSITIFAAFLTWWAQKQYSNVLASSAITLIFGSFLKKSLSQAAFCGTFAGMSSRAVIPTWQGAVGLGALTSILFEWLIHKNNLFYGMGGRLSVIAFIATNIVAALINVPTGMSMSSFQSLLSSLKRTTLIRFACWHALGSVATILLRQAINIPIFACPYRASAVVGLIGALFLEDYYSALALYGGSFVGMSYPHMLFVKSKKYSSKFHSESLISLIFSFGIAGAFAGLIKGATNDLNYWTGGWGGKTGSCAFIGCIMFRSLFRACSAIRESRHRGLIKKYWRRSYVQGHNKKL